MTEKEVEIVRKLGCSAFSVYSYLKMFPEATTPEMESNLGLSYRTIRLAFQLLEENSVLRRIISNDKSIYQKRLVSFYGEEEWRLQ